MLSIPPLNLVVVTKLSLLYISTFPSSSLVLYQISLQISSRLGKDQQQGDSYISLDFEPIP